VGTIKKWPAGTSGGLSRLPKEKRRKKGQTPSGKRRCQPKGGIEIASGEANSHLEAKKTKGAQTRKISYGCQELSTRKKKEVI